MVSVQRLIDANQGDVLKLSTMPRDLGMDARVAALVGPKERIGAASVSRGEFSERAKEDVLTKR